MYNKFIKRLIDIVLSGIGIVVLSLVYMIVALAIKTAVAFKQGAAGVKLLDANGVQVDDADGAHPATVNADTGVVTQTSFKTGKSASDVKAMAYTYDNIIIPQETLPTLKAELKNYKLVLSSEDYLIPMDLRKPIPNCIDIDLDDFSKLVDKYI